MAMLFACIYVPDFPVEAVVRAEPALREQAVAVLEGTPPLLRVAAANLKAREAGIECGMTRMQAEAGSVELRRRSPRLEAAAHAALLDCAHAFSPRVESTAADTVLLDAAGLESLFGPPPKLAREIARRAGDLGMEANVSMAANADAAMHAARGFPGVTVIPAGAEAERLGTLPVEVLFLTAADEAQAKQNTRFIEVLDRWGVRNLRGLANLPEIAITERLGQPGLHLQRLARGSTSRTLVPVEPALRFEESMELEYPVDLLEPLSFLLSRLLEQLCARLNARALATNELRVELALDAAGETAPGVHRRKLTLPVPMQDAKVFLKLLQLDLKANPPAAPVSKILVAAEPVKPRVAQGGLFVPAAPEPERLELTLARIAAIVGQGRVGAAEILNTHRPDAFRMVRFAVPAVSADGPDRAGNPDPASARMALRVFRPPLPARVELRDGVPACVSFNGVRAEVLAAAGPWRSAGDWWNSQADAGSPAQPAAAAWSRDEWDLALASGDSVALYRLFREQEGWWVEGSFD